MKYILLGWYFLAAATLTEIGGPRGFASKDECDTALEIVRRVVSGNNAISACYFRTTL